jgi:AhpD family alkylhydroperoxidase
MKPRINYGTVAPGTYAAMDALDQYLQTCDVEKSLVMLVQLRASQINGCAYCLDMHWKDLCAIGEQEQRLYSLPAWRECPYYHGARTRGTRVDRGSDHDCGRPRTGCGVSRGAAALP